MKFQNEKFGKKALFCSKKRGSKKLRREKKSNTLGTLAKLLSILTKTIERKSGIIVCPDGEEIGHNSCVTITDYLLRTANDVLALPPGTWH